MTKLGDDIGVRVCVSLVIIQYRDVNLLRKLLASLERHSDRKLINEVIIVNNGLTLNKEERSKLETYRTLPIQIVDNPQKSYASGVNRGAVSAKGDVFIISNNDVEILPDYSIRPMLDYLQENPNVGVVGPQQIYPDGSWQRSYGQFPSLREAIISLMMLDSMCNGIRKLLFRYNWLSRRPKKVDYIDGAFMIIKRSCFEELGGFDEDYVFYGEDADFCWRAHRAGWEAIFVPAVRVKHIRGASSTVGSFDEFAIHYFKAKQKAAKKTLSLRRSKCYFWLMKTAALEKALLYTFISKLVCSPHWRNRALRARESFKAICQLY